MRELETERIDLFVWWFVKFEKLYDMWLINSARYPILVEPPEENDTREKDELLKL